MPSGTRSIRVSRASETFAAAPHEEDHMTARISPAAVLALVLLLASLTGAALAADERVLIVGDASPVNTLDPAASLIAQNIGFSRNLFQSLLRYKPNSIELEGDV